MLLSKSYYYGTGEGFFLLLISIFEVLFMALGIFFIFGCSITGSFNIIKNNVKEKIKFITIVAILIIINTSLCIIINKNGSNVRKCSDENIIFDIQNEFVDDDITVLPSKKDSILLSITDYAHGRIITQRNGNWKYSVDYKNDTIRIVPDNVEDEKIISR